MGTKFVYYGMVRIAGPVHFAAGAVLALTALLFPVAWIGTDALILAAPPASGTAFYVDCTAGSDKAEGTSPAAAWSSLARTSSASLAPGDSILLKRGCRWRGPLEVAASGTADAPITVGAYGDGALPIVENAYVEIDVTGSWVTVRDVHVRSDAPTVDKVCKNQPAGARFGVRIEPGASHVVVQDSLVTELYAGVRIDLGSHDNQVVHNTFRNNNMKSDDPESDAGAVAIDVQGDGNEISYNSITGSDACSHFFGGRDGSAVSIYGGIDNVVDHNISFQNHDFIEVGNARANHTLIVYNADWSTLRLANFLVVHGNNSRYGPVNDTRAAHNTSVLTAPDSQSMITVGDVAGTGFSVRANIMWSNGVIAGRKASLDEGDNIFWADDGSPYVGFTMSASSQTVNPRLVDAVVGDLRLRPSSPAIDAVRPIDLGAWGRTDVDGIPVPQGYGPDIGAYEYVDPQALVTPVPWASDAPATPGATAPGTGPSTPGPAAPTLPGPEPSAMATMAPSPSPAATPAAPEPTPASRSDGGLLLPTVLLLGAGSAAFILLLLRRRLL